jgi:hypothetical protein
MIKILKYAAELFWPPRERDGLIFTAFDPKRHVVDLEDLDPRRWTGQWSDLIGQRATVRTTGRTGAGKSRAFLDELQLMSADEYIGMHREDRRNLAQEAGREKYGDDIQYVLRRYADVLSSWGSTNRASMDPIARAIGTEQRGTAQILRDIADGNKPVVFREGRSESG